VDAAVSGVSQLLRERRVELTVTLAPSLPDVRVDPMRLEQTLTEIVSNALDAMPPPDGGRLTIEGRRDANDTGTDGVTLTITDSGRGIAPEVLANVCEPFFTTRAEGTGLGLAIAKRYVEETGGQLSITSVVGGGTTVRIWLPSAGEATPAQAPSSVPERQLA
jgi:two-component system sensor histidine kinase HydH